MDCRLGADPAAAEGAERRRLPRTESGTPCPICLGQVQGRCPLETDCGHWFCTECLAAFWEHGGRHRQLRCPCCRAPVGMLHLGLVPAEEATAAGHVAVELVGSYNRQFGGLPRSWLQMVQDAPVLLRRLFAASISAQGLAWVTLARVVICLLTTVCKWLHSGGGSQPHPARFVFCLEIRK